jgi:aminoglycoside phosphotransferase (APT) family kinase protein
MESITNFLTANWDRLSLEQFGKPPLSTLVLTPGFRASSNVILMMFTQGKTQPALVAKVSRLPGDHSELRSEAENLERVQSSRQGGFDSIPRLVALSENHDHSFLVETMLTGSLMSPAVIRQQKATCTEAVVNWLIELAVATAKPSANDNGWFERLVAEPTDRLRNALPLSPREEQLLARSWEITAPLAGQDIPLVFEHGDASDPNLLTMQDGRVGVVDWELAQANSLPAVDVFFFLTYVAFSQRRAKKQTEYTSAFDDAFFGPSAWAIPHVLRYAESVGLAKESLTPLFVLCWQRYLAKLARRLNPGKRNLLPSETVAWFRANRYYSLWKHAAERAQELKWNQ